MEEEKEGRNGRGRKSMTALQKIHCSSKMLYSALKSKTKCEFYTMAMLYISDQHMEFCVSQIPL